MIFGHNTNVAVGDVTIHVQTEDRGSTSALIDTTVYSSGRVMHRRTNNYFDLLPLDAEREEELRKRVDEQHRGVLEEVRSGSLHLNELRRPQEPAKAAAPEASASTATAAHDVRPAVHALELELANARSWLAGKRATLHVVVRDKESRAGVGGARVAASVEGAAEVRDFLAVTNENGEATLEFEMPKMARADAALVIEALHGEARGSLKFQLRAKVRTPAES